ncbi:glutamate receptor 2.7-like [Salvia miltiorrhiza]|uniref:glutamate receptor 2.7-like n=1 Tax=Salvia miltiorrhiza TaxID=226208 RepID=UPI0025AC6CD4|nr:glutamate receptor 2.7-like [Salvia miltiorrhiza]
MQTSRFCCFSMLILMSFCVVRLNYRNATAAEADVGVILDLDTPLGKICSTCIAMAIEDFYSNRNHSTVIVPHFRDSMSDVVAAASAAIDLLKNTQVMAILGPQKSNQADFVIDIGERVRVPIISPATSPALSPKESPYFIRSAWCSSSQAKAIAAIIKGFGWKEVVVVYEDSNDGTGLLPHLSVNLLQSNVVVSNLSSISPSAENDQVLEELYNLKAMQTRVLIVDMLPDLASRFFQMAKEVGMMTEGYAWVISDPLTSLLSSVDSVTIEAMQGVLGVKAYVPRSEEVRGFTKRWSKRFHEENPNIDRTELNVFGLWAYDSTTALAEAIERVGVPSPRFKKPVDGGNSTDLEAIGTSNSGSSLASAVRNFASKGLSGDFKITNGQLQPSAFEIVNVIGKGDNMVGFWTEKYGISKELKMDDDKPVYSTEKDNLRGILWPGQTSNVPKGCRKKLRVGVPHKTGFSEFVNVVRNTETKAVEATGFCIDVFEEVMRSLPYAVQYEYIPFETADYPSVGYYDDLVNQIYLEKYDAVVGDVTITSNRSKYVDFTFPYTESGVSTVVPIKNNERKNGWIFLKPLTTALWLTIGAFFIFTGLVVWVFEHRINKHFRGPPMQQVGMIFWFSFSTLVFAHREKVKSNLTRFVVIVWVFVVVVLTSSYTASLTSMLTVQKLNSIEMIVKRGEYVGIQTGSLITGGMIFDYSKFREYSSVEEYDNALSKGSRNGGVAAIVDEIPYIRLFLSKYCHKYTMIDPKHKTSGFGFAFKKGSPLVSDTSTAILNLIEDGKIDMITRRWFGGEDCSADGLESLDLDRFTGLFLVVGLSSSTALAIFFSTFLYQNQHILASSASIKKKLHDLARAFVQEKDDVSKHSETSGEIVLAQSPSFKTSCDREEMLSQDEEITKVEIEMHKDDS